jgi:hypothetical protein
MSSFCLSAYTSWALMTAALQPNMTWGQETFAGLCYSELATCEVAADAINATSQTSLARCDEQHPIKAMKK